MALNPGSRFGGYDILALIGSGGMGEVYRARDARLGREVALKVLPAGFASPERLRRFEQEARDAAALNHPNILEVYEIGEHDGVTYVVSEPLDGELLRARMIRPLSLRRTRAYGAQIASALAAAHDRGIVHRGLNPESVLVSPHKRVKLLDFGLASLIESSPQLSGTSSPISYAYGADTVSHAIGIGYMAPEQLRGEVTDQRTDLFSFGVLLYEMLAGRPPFQGDTAEDLTRAILTKEPEGLPTGSVPGEIKRLIRKCLKKDPAERPQSAHDLEFDTKSPSAPSQERPAQTHRRHVTPWRLSPAGVAVVSAFAVLAGVLLGRLVASDRSLATDPPVLQRLTFERGILRSARFADDGTVVYSAAWDGSQDRLYKTRPGASASTPLELPPAHLFSVSRSGELAVSIGYRFDGWLGSGALARARLMGGDARPELENIREAELTPSGSEMAIVRRINGRDQLEWPIGKVLYATSGFITTPRFSPDGDLIAFGDHPTYGDESGDIAVIDTKGVRRALVSGLTGIRGVAWTPAADEVWFSAGVDDTQTFSSLQAVTLTGQRRTLLATPVDLALMDIARNGRVLVSAETRLRHIETLLPGDSAARDFSLFDASVASAISNDGSQLLITRQDPASVYMRRTDQATPIRLGDGEGFDLSRDGKWALSIVVAPPSRVLLLPTGIGEPKVLANPDQMTIATARLLPDGEQVVYLGHRPGEPWRAFVQSVNGGIPRPFTGLGVSVLPSRMIVVTNDGQRVAMTDADGQVKLFPIDGEAAQPIPGTTAGEYPLAWSADGRSVFLTRGTSPPWRIDRLDLATGQRMLWKEVAPTQNAGVRISQIMMSADGQAFAHSYSQLLSNLYSVDGLR